MTAVVVDGNMPDLDIAFDDAPAFEAVIDALLGRCRQHFRE